MSKTLASTHPFEPAGLHRPCLPPEGGQVSPDRVASHTHMQGRSLRCLSGHLWVTFENDPMDHVVRAGEALPVPSAGRVVIGGRGRYAL